MFEQTPFILRGEGLGEEGLAEALNGSLVSAGDAWPVHPGQWLKARGVCLDRMMVGAVSHLALRHLRGLHREDAASGMGRAWNQVQKGSRKGDGPLTSGFQTCWTSPLFLEMKAFP